MVWDGDIFMRMKKQINVEIGERIKISREKARMTQEQFAERIEVSPQFVSDLERGVVGISLQTLKKTCIVLGVSSDDLLFGTQSDNRGLQITELCRNLTADQFCHLMTIIKAYHAALQSAE